MFEIRTHENKATIIEAVIFDKEYMSGFLCLPLRDLKSIKNYNQYFGTGLRYPTGQLKSRFAIGLEDYLLHNLSNKPLKTPHGYVWKSHKMIFPCTNPNRQFKRPDRATTATYKKSGRIVRGIKEVRIIVTDRNKHFLKYVGRTTYCKECVNIKPMYEVLAPPDHEDYEIFLDRINKFMESTHGQRILETLSISRQTSI